MNIIAPPTPSVRATSKVQPRWQTVLRSAVQDPVVLCRMLDLPDSLHEAAQRAAQSFPLLVPQPYIARIEAGNPADPLLRQVLPLDLELVETEGFTSDPVGDQQARCGTGLLHKYHGRALLMTSGTCGIHCRFCFRRHYPHQAYGASTVGEQSVQKIAHDGALREVILSGGDPLTLPDSRLADFSKRLAEVRHLRRLRIHTRLPIVIPDRVTDSLLAWLTGTRLTPILVLHANHPRELDAQVAEAVGRLVTAGVVVLNQAVLLRQVNDDVPTLCELSERLVDLRIVPYYLHQLDRVAGAAHFEVPIERGRQLVLELQRRLPGYAVPRYVREIPGQPSKTCALGNG